jgi:hypothetical protein
MPLYRQGVGVPLWYEKKYCYGIALICLRNAGVPLWSPAKAPFRDAGWPGLRMIPVAVRIARGRSREISVLLKGVNGNAADLLYHNRA